MAPVLGALAALSIAQPAAAASQRFASPSGSPMAACSAAAPCDLHTAVSQAGASDDVTVLPGDYTLTTTLADPAEITIHGIADKPRPRIMFTQPTQFGVSIANGSTLRYLEVDQEYPNRYAVNGVYANLDQLLIRGSGSTPCSVAIFEATMTNSIVVGPKTAICSEADTTINSGLTTSWLRNVTAIADESSEPAITADARGPSAISNLILFNVIARGD